jgi:type IV pilus assembly protein PilW
MRPSPSHRGVTLIEVLIGMTISLIVITGAVVAAKTQQKAYIDGTRLRSAQGSGRRALLALERLVPYAGWGLDASLALDFSGWTQGSACPAPMGGSCPVDATSGPDELVFLFRDPWYWLTNYAPDAPIGNAWVLKAVDGANVTVMARAGDVFRRGQIVSAVCYGTSSYTYFTLDQTVGPVATAGAQAIALKPVVTTNPFRRQDVAALTGTQTQNCYNPNAAGLATNPARLFLVNRYRIHVAPAAVGAAGTATEYDPLLLLDRGVDMNLDNRVDVNDEELLAEGIESFQVSYGFLNNTIPVAGRTSGTAIALSAGTVVAADTTADRITTTLFPDALPAGATSPYQASSFYSYSFSPPTDGSAWMRASNHQANIQLVRIALLARSIERDSQSFNTPAQLLPLYNQDTAPSWATAASNGYGGHDGYQRVVFETSIVLPNMSFRAMPYF